MHNERSKVGLGGGCHWCTEAVFQSLKGVVKVQQGYVASTLTNDSFSEAVIVHFNLNSITLRTLIEIHLLTHQSKSNHAMRKKYRSAIYTFDDIQSEDARNVLSAFQKNNNDELITQVLPFHDFEPSREAITNYYYNNPEKPFCEIYIKPKLQMLLSQFSRDVDQNKVGHLKNQIKKSIKIHNAR